MTTVLLSSYMHQHEQRVQTMTHQEIVMMMMKIELLQSPEEVCVCRRVLEAYFISLLDARSSFNKRSLTNPQVPTQLQKQNSKNIPEYQERILQTTDDNEQILPNWQESSKKKESHTTSDQLDFSIPEISNDNSDLYPTDKQLKQCC